MPYDEEQTLTGQDKAARPAHLSSRTSTEGSEIYSTSPDSFGSGVTREEARGSSASFVWTLTVGVR
jgi:hypothetical protein